MAIIARLTSANTPATAPVFLKNLYCDAIGMETRRVDQNLTHVLRPVPLLGLKVGFAKMEVCVSTDPSLAVEVITWVTIGGAVVVVSPWLLVVVMKTVVTKVELQNITKANRVLNVG